jgi:hypothetical protein
MLDLAGFKKPLYFFKQSQWSEKDMVHIGMFSLGDKEKPGPINWDHEVACQWKGTDGETVRVVCCTNCQEAELLLNGESFGLKKREEFPDGTIYWDIPYRTGTLKAIGKSNGESSCTHVLKTAGEPTKVVMNADTLSLKADRQDVAHVEVNILDQDNQLVYDATNELHCELDGPGEIIGIECSNPTSHQDYKANFRQAYHGKLLIYVQAKDQSGTIKLKTSSVGLESSYLEIEVQNLD